MKPVIIINFKTYNQGKDVLKLAKIIEKKDKSIIVGVQPTDIFNVSKNTKLQVYSQHVDYQEVGRNTGFVLPEAVKANGANGVFLNHSEHRLKFGVIKKTVLRCRQVGLKVGIFAKDLRQAKKIRKLNPDFLIIEPPKLVAGKVSVSTANPKLIFRVSKNLNHPFIVGAGIKTNRDIKIAVKLGSVGIAVSSAITKSKNPKLSLDKLLGNKNA